MSEKKEWIKKPLNLHYFIRILNIIQIFPIPGNK